MGSRFNLLLGVALAAVTACKSSVAVNSGGSGGFSGSHGSGATMSSGTKSTSTATGIDPALCDEFCTAVGTCVNNCQGECKTYLQSPCESAGAAIVACLTASYNTMTCQPGDCSAETNAYTQCHSTVPQQCTVNSCGGAASNCTCTSECQAGEERTICDGTNGTAVCTCYLNAIMIAFCQRPSTDLYSDGVCDPKSGCCSHFFGT